MSSAARTQAACDREALSFDWATETARQTAALTVLDAQVSSFAAWADSFIASLRAPSPEIEA